MYEEVSDVDEMRVTVSAGRELGAGQDDVATHALQGLRWRITSPKIQARELDSVQVGRRRQLAGSPQILADRLLVQAAAGTELEAVLPYVDQEVSGIVLSAGPMGNKKLKELVGLLPERGFTAPISFDPEGYRKHIASVEAPFSLESGGLFGETLDNSLSRQRTLGFKVAMTPTGYVRAGSLDALDRAAELANALDRDDFLFTLPIEVTVLDDPVLLERVMTTVQALRPPTALILGGQFDPFDTNAEPRIIAARSLVAGLAHVIPIRTDFNGFDLLAHGAFAAAIGAGGSKRHAVDPDQRPRTFNKDDPSPSVLYSRIMSYWRGSKIATEHGRTRAPACECKSCDGASTGRFLSKEHSTEAKSHGIAVWQEWARMMLSNQDLLARASFWKNRCQAAVDEHGMLSVQLRRAKPFAARP